MSVSRTTNVVFVLFPEVTQLDFSGPAQFLARLPGARVFVAAENTQPISTDSGFSIVPNASFASCPQADVLCVPGGSGVVGALTHAPLVEFVRAQGARARWITSVCTGAFILGVAGFLVGKRATTHWAYTELLHRVGAVHEDARVVTDGNVITAGGVTSGIDFALTLIAELAGSETAQQLQLAHEYDPAPPFDCGRPGRSPEALVAQLKAHRYENASSRMAEALAVARATVAG
ncbi:MAG TPA: DJ-1/PfpI family protein [Steroidobacteraceae bacterium]|nr:DJ-1/PfpI family protein [Steroidobacteraceae bacterium]